MSKIAVIGAAGRMGRRLVANIAETPGMTLAGAMDRKECGFIGSDAGALAGIAPNGVQLTDDLETALKDADAIIDFATGNVIETARAAAAKGCLIVIGTTALSKEDTNELRAMGTAGAKIVLASNYSIGVNLLFHLAAQAAKILDEKFDIEIVEAHHNQKKDAPSGTAVTLAKTVAEVRGLDYDKDVVHGRNGIVGARTNHEIGMHSVRGGDIVGDHTIMFCAQGERFELTHKASSRDTFAKGAIRAVAFLETAKPGFYNMRDVLGLN